MTPRHLLVLVPGDQNPAAEVAFRDQNKDVA
jgi:hypothetical protein